MNRWEVYELLKGNERYSIDELENTDKYELVEGIAEFIYARHRNGAWSMNDEEMIEQNWKHIPEI